MEPLISVVVISYNSEKYIIETLDSIYDQDYKNIELIITDDCSGDGTVGLAREWLGAHSQRFVNSELIESETNRGIPQNCNTGVKRAKGEYIRLMAADDILMSGALRIWLEESEKTPDVIVFTKVRPFGDEDGAAKMRGFCERGYGIFEKSRRKKYRALLADNYIAGPSGGFVSRKVYEKIGYYDERYKYVEDYPFLIKAMRAGYDFRLIDCVSTGYRIHASSTCLTDARFADSVDRYFRLEKNRYLLQELMLIRWWRQTWINVICDAKKRAGPRRTYAKAANLLYVFIPATAVKRIINKIKKS